MFTMSIVVSWELYDADGFYRTAPEICHNDDYFHTSFSEFCSRPNDSGLNKSIDICTPRV